MLEFAPIEATVVRCLCSAAALDALPLPAGAYACRVAPTDMMFVAEPNAGQALVSHLADHFATANPYALIKEQSDAWSTWVLTGDAHRRAFARLSPIPLPAGRAFIQGGVAHVPAKVLVCDDAIYVMVASTLRHHLRARLLASCADLDPKERSAAPFESRHADADAVR